VADWGERGLEEARLAIRLNPHDLGFPTFLDASLTFIGRIDEAMEAFRRAEQLSTDYPSPSSLQGHGLPLRHRLGRSLSSSR